jgi:hypothetical protein
VLRQCRHFAVQAASSGFLLGAEIALVWASFEHFRISL